MLVPYCTEIIPSAVEPTVLLLISLAVSLTLFLVYRYVPLTWESLPIDLSPPKTATAIGKGVGIVNVPVQMQYCESSSSIVLYFCLSSYTVPSPYDSMQPLSMAKAIMNRHVRLLTQCAPYSF